MENTRMHEASGILKQSKTPASPTDQKTDNSSFLGLWLIMPRFWAFFAL